jgi:succinyl-diaminopimelate desuccinylase
MPPIDEVLLAEHLIAHDTSHQDGIRDAAGFICGWLDAHGVTHREEQINGLPAVVASAGEGARTVLWSSHFDVVPGRREQFAPRREGGRLYGRGAYDMKGALAGMMAALADLTDQPPPGIAAKLLIVPDEESEATALEAKATARLADAGHLGEFAICGEPTDLQIGVQAKGALVLEVQVDGRSAHGSTPWLGENAVLKAVELYRRICRLPFAGERSELFDGPSISLGRIFGGDAVNRVPDRCTMHLDIRYLPTQDPAEVLRQVRSLGASTQVHYHVPAARVNPHQPHVQALRHAVRAHRGGPALGVGRNGASDAVVFLRRGVPSVEFGPTGGDHHGPDEYVEAASIGTYRRVLVEFVSALARLRIPASPVE